LNDIDDARDYWTDPDLAHDREDDLKRERDILEGRAVWVPIPGTICHELRYVKEQKMVTNESVAAEIEAMIEKLNEARNRVLGGRPEDLGIANMLLGDLSGGLAIGMIGNNIRDLYRQLNNRAATPIAVPHNDPLIIANNNPNSPRPTVRFDEQSRRCEAATAEKFGKFPVAGVVVDKTH
jgi:hypothetical protein